MICKRSYCDDILCCSEYIYPKTGFSARVAISAQNRALRLNVSMKDWISDTLSQGYTNLQSLLMLNLHHDASLNLHIRYAWYHLGITLRSRHFTKLCKLVSL